MNNNIETLRVTSKIPLRFKIDALLLPALFLWKFGIVGILYYAIVFISLLVHEYAHVWAALKRDVETVRVVVHAFGAAALMRPENSTLNYKNEFAIAIAGPIASFVLGIVFLVPYLASINGPFNVIMICAFLNLGLGVFNMLPMYPSDGGRILNSILSRFVGYTRAVKISTIVAYVVAGALIVLGLCIKHYFLIGVSIFVIILANINRRTVLGHIEALKSMGVRPVRRV